MMICVQNKEDCGSDITRGSKRLVAANRIW